MPTVTTVKFTGMFAGLRSSRRQKKAGPYLRDYIAKYSGMAPEMVRIDQKVNNYMMGSIISRGGVLKLSINKNAGVVEVKLANNESAAKAAEKASAAKAPNAGKAAAGVLQDKPKQQEKKTAEAAGAQKLGKDAKPQDAKPAKQAKEKADQAKSPNDSGKSAGSAGN